MVLMNLFAGQAKTQREQACEQSGEERVGGTSGSAVRALARVR